MAELQFVSPADNTAFDIAPGTAATGAQMPVIQAEVRIEGLDPDPTPTATFQWLVSIQFQCSDCKNGRAREINDEFSFTTVGGKAAINFPRVRGGKLAIAVSVDTSGAVLQHSDQRATYPRSEPASRRSQCGLRKPDRATNGDARKRRPAIPGSSRWRRFRMSSIQRRSSGRRRPVSNYESSAHSRGPLGLAGEYQSRPPDSCPKADQRSRIPGTRTKLGCISSVSTEL